MEIQLQKKILQRWNNVFLILFIQVSGLALHAQDSKVDFHLNVLKEAVLEGNNMITADHHGDIHLAPGSQTKINNYNIGVNVYLINVNQGSVNFNKDSVASFNNHLVVLTAYAPEIKNYSDSLLQEGVPRNLQDSLLAKKFAELSKTTAKDQYALDAPAQNCGALQSDVLLAFDQAYKWNQLENKHTSLSDFLSVKRTEYQDQLQVEMDLCEKYPSFVLKDQQTGKKKMGFLLKDIRKDPNLILIDEYSCGLARVKKNNKYGFVNQEGVLAIGFQFDYAENYKKGITLVRNNDTTYIIDLSKDILFEHSTSQPSNMKVYSTNLVQLRYDYNKLMLVNLQDSIIYDITKSLFDSDYVIANKGRNQLGLLDTLGNALFPFDYSSIVMQGEFVIGDNYQTGKADLYNLTNKRFVSKSNYNSIGKVNSTDSLGLFLGSTELIAVSKGIDAKGIINLKGKVILDCKFDRIDYSNNLITYSSQKESGILTSAGEKIYRESSDHQFDIKQLDSLHYKICKDYNSCALINHDGKTRTSFDYTTIETHKNAFKVSKEVGRSLQYGILNDEGKLIVPCRYREISDFNKWGYALVGIGNYRSNSFDVLDESYNLVFENSYNKIRLSDQWKNLIPVCKDYGEWGVIDLQENVLVNFIYSEIKSFDENKLAIVKRRSTAREILEKYTEKKGDNPTTEKLKYGYWGLIDSKGLEVIPPIFNHVGNISNQQYKAILNDHKYIINTSGECISDNKDLYYKQVKSFYKDK